MKKQILFKYMVVMVGMFGVIPHTYAEAFDHQHTAFTKVLNAHVDAGKVDYSALKISRATLDSYLLDLEKVSKEDFQHWSEDEQLTFLINLYNAETLQLIIDHYPVDSIKNIGGVFTKPWDIKCVEIFGETVTLNTIEHQMIRKLFDEPRIHVALVCAAKGCPHLRSSAYTATQLSDELDEQTRLFLSDTNKNDFELSSSTLHISPIFKWYKKDFQKNGNTILKFIRNHANKDWAAQLDTKNIRITYTDYDWSLNDQNSKK